MNKYILIISMLLMVACKNRIKKKKKIFTLHEMNESTQKPQIGDTILYRYIMEVDDSIIYNSFKLDKPSVQGIAAQSHSGLDIYSALTKMNKGDSAEFYINADSFFNKTNYTPRPSFIDAGADIKFSVKLVDIKNAEQMQTYRTFILDNEKLKEQKRIQDFMGADSAEYNFDFGIYQQVIAEGKGNLPSAGDDLELNMKIRTHKELLLVDTKYTGNAMKYKLGSGTIVPVVLEQVFKSLKQGEKRNVVIPYNAAYGRSGFSNVPPFSTLYCEIERL